MPRRSVTGIVELPKGVRAVKRKRKIYYYFQRGRGTPDAGEVIALPGDTQDPKFWEKYRAVSGTQKAETGTFHNLIPLYRESGEFLHLSDRTRENYEFFLKTFEAAWGDLLVVNLTRKGAYAHRDTMKEKPTTANHMLSVLRTFLEWCVQHHDLPNNIAIGMKRLHVDDDGAKPWPEAVYNYVVENAPDDLMRLAVLGRATGQRSSDLCKMRPIDRRNQGIDVKIKKLRGKAHWMPLTAADAARIDSWGVEPMVFYLLSARNNAYTSDHLNSRWNRWLVGEGKPIARLVKEAGVTIHGLRATAVVDRRMKGVSHQEISSELGMSLQMVMHYSRFCDQELAATASRDRHDRA